MDRASSSSAMSVGKRNYKPTKSKKGVSQNSELFDRSKKLPIPGSDITSDQIFTFPFLQDPDTIKYLKKHNRIMFIIRGPPGTGKETLALMISSLYPESVVFSAKQYFELPLAELRNKESSVKSHKWCHKKVEDGCRNNTPVLIIKNSNVRKWEMNPYFKMAQEFQYTVVIADASKKFCFDPDVLAKSNTQGLHAGYFISRLKQWAEIIPLFTGWFLSPADSCWLLSKSKELVKNITNMETDFQIPFKLNYEDEKQLFCISTYFKCESSDYSLDNQIQKELGKMFYISVIGFILTSDIVAALVKLTPEQIQICEIGKEFKHQLSSEDFLNRFESLSIDDHSNRAVNNFSNVITNSVATVEVEKQGDLLLENVSYIVLNHSNTAAFPYIKNVDTFSNLIFSEDGKQENTLSNKFWDTDDGVRLHQAQNDIWILSSSEKYVLQSVFTGLYL